MSAPRRQAAGSRIEFIDLLRGWAVIVMIETHVFNATSVADIASGRAFQYLTFINGLVAPSFLFASGFAFAVTIQRKVTEYVSLSPAFFKHLGRIVMIWLIGYTLHIPVFSLQKIMTGTTIQEWQAFFQVDILQCIAASLVFLMILLILFRTESRLYWVTTSVGIVIVGVSPLIWMTDYWSILPWPLAGYLNGLRHSLFPLFPWSAFLFAGAVTGYHYMQKLSGDEGSQRAGRERSFIYSALWAGGSMILLSIIIEPLVIRLYPNHPYWHSSPGFFLLRLGIVFLLSGALFLFSQSGTSSFRARILLFGRESLLVYVLHLLLIYGTFGPLSFRKFSGQSFGYAEAAVATVALIALMYFTAKVWNTIKLNSPRTKRILNVATLVLVIGSFLFGTG